MVSRAGVVHESLPASGGAERRGSYWAAIVSLVVFFVVGLAVLLGVNVCKAGVAAGSTPPTIAGGPRARPAHHG